MPVLRVPVDASERFACRKRGLIESSPTVTLIISSSHSPRPRFLFTKATHAPKGCMADLSPSADGNHGARCCRFDSTQSVGHLRNVNAIEDRLVANLESGQLACQHCDRGARPRDARVGLS